MSWRCHDCFGEPVHCSSCLVVTHQCSPFHRVSRWDGWTFFRSSLSDAGLVLHIGHEGRPCSSPTTANTSCNNVNHSINSDSCFPSADSGIHNGTSTAPSPFVDPDLLFPTDIPPLSSWEYSGVFLDTMKTQQHLDADGNPWLTIVDTTGIHQVQAHYCRCAESLCLPDYIQLLRNGLFPASIAQPRTVFTFRVLDDYDLLNLETKATPQR